MPSAYHPPKEPVKHVDPREDEWDNINLNSHLSVHAWKHKLEVEKAKNAKLSKDGVKIKSMKWAVSALRL
jgi:hypothetical protein